MSHVNIYDTIYLSSNYLYIYIIVYIYCVYGHEIWWNFSAISTYETFDLKYERLSDKFKKDKEMPIFLDVTSSRIYKPTRASKPQSRQDIKCLQILFVYFHKWSKNKLSPWLYCVQNATSSLVHFIKVISPKQECHYTENGKILLTCKPKWFDQNQIHP